GDRRPAVERRTVSGLTGGILVKRQPLLWQSGCLLLVTVAAWALVPVPALAASDPEGRASAETPAEKTLKALNQTLTFDFNEQPLETVLERIREQTKLKLVSDFLTFEQMGLVDEGTMVTVKLEKAKVRTGLQTVLTPFNLTYVVLGDTVLITTEEVA